MIFGESWNFYDYVDFWKTTKNFVFKKSFKKFISSLKKYQISKKTLRADILEIINKNLSKKKSIITC